MDIRRATLNDLSPLIALENHVFHSDRIPPRQMRRFIQSSHSQLWLAHQGDQLLGYVLMLFHRGTQLARIYSLAVAPECRGQGIAGALLCHCEKQAIDEGYITLRLEVREDNSAALALYQKLGYKPLKTLVHYYDDLANGVRLKKRLDPPGPRLRLNVPLYIQTTPFTCGAACLQMAFSGLDPDYAPSRTEELQLWREATTIYMAAGHGGCSGHGLALAASRRGFHAELWSTSEGIPFIHSVRDPEKKAVITLVHQHFEQQLQDAAIPMFAEAPTRARLEQWLAEGACVLLLISTYRFNGNKEPHWVLLSGMSEHLFFLHDPHVSRPEDVVTAAFVPVSKTSLEQILGFGKQKHTACVVIRTRAPASNALAG